MKIKNLLLGALVTSMALTACEKSENSDSPNRDEMPKSVTITLPNINQISRATGDAMSASQVSLKNFKVFFLDADGAEQTIPAYNGEDQQVYFSSDATDDSWETIGDAGRNITYHFVPAATAKVVVIGNLGDVAYNTAIAATYDVLNDGDADIATDDNGHPLYPLYGDSALTPKTGTDDADHANVYTANVTLAPRIARFEIYGFGYSKDADAEYTYTKLQLDKIALSNYRKQYTLEEGAAEGDAVACPAEAAQVWDYIAAAAEPWANTFNNFELEQDAKKFVNGTDIPAGDQGDNATGIITFGLTKVAEAANNPELLLSFYGLKDGTTDKTPLYLRGKFTTAEAFTAGKIYRVFFPIVDGSWTQPERCVELNVKVANWEIVTVTPEF